MYQDLINEAKSPIISINESQKIDKLIAELLDIRDNDRAGSILIRNGVKDVRLIINLPEERKSNTVIQVFTPPNKKEEIEDLKLRLESSSSSVEKRKLRAQLRKRGHKGGVRSKS